MYIILGGTGHVGSAVAETLLGKEKKVTVITHDERKVSEWEEKGARVEVADVYDTEKLREIFNKGERLFLLNPPADIAKDTVAEERRTLSSILKALENSGIEKLIGESTYGAQPGEGVGDLGVLYELEENLRKMNLSSGIIRAAYYMSNWDASLETARTEGVVHTLYPPDFKLPMVAPKDIGRIAAGFLVEDTENIKIHYVEGPETYSSAEVAAAFGKALDKFVEAVQTPKEKWLSALKQVGFSDQAADSMKAMTEVTLDEKYEKPTSPIRGKTTLDEYIGNLVSEKNEKHSASSCYRQSETSYRRTSRHTRRVAYLKEN